MIYTTKQILPLQKMLLLRLRMIFSMDLHLTDYDGGDIMVALMLQQEIIS